MSFSASRLLIPVLVLVQMLRPGLASAQMSSTNYRIPFDALSGGGERGVSGSYVAEDSLSEAASPTDENVSSANYTSCVGYGCLVGAPSVSIAYAVQSAPCDAVSASQPPYAVSLGALAANSVATAANRICVRVTGNVPGLAIQVRDANAGLASSAVPADIIPSSTATLVPNIAGYGVCSSNAQNGLAAVAPYNGSCGTVSGHAVGALTASNQTIWTATGAVNNAFGELLTKASISGATPVHGDYQDTLTLTATITY